MLYPTELRADIDTTVSTDPGRGGEIRTPDILLPKQARYQATLHPESGALYLAYDKKSIMFGLFVAGLMKYLFLYSPMATLYFVSLLATRMGLLCNIMPSPICVQFVATRVSSNKSLTTMSK
jgi:hypothetical protein